MIQPWQDDSEPAWAPLTIRNNLNHEQRKGDPGKPGGFPVQEEAIRIRAKGCGFPVAGIWAGLPQLERARATEAEAPGSNPSSATASLCGLRQVIELPSNSAYLMGSGPGQKRMVLSD